MVALGDANIYGARFEYDPEDPDGYRSGIARVGQAAGGEALAVKLYEIPPGESLCPYHYEYEEEWLVVLDGAVHKKLFAARHSPERPPERPTTSESPT